MGSVFSLLFWKKKVKEEPMVRVSSISLLPPTNKVVTPSLGMDVSRSFYLSSIRSKDGFTIPDEEVRVKTK